MMEHKTTGGKKPRMPVTKGPQHMDDDKFELDINTGKFIRKKKAPVTEKGDESTSRKGKPTSNTSKPSDTGNESKGRDKKKKKMTAVPLLEDDDNDDDNDLQIVDDEDHDKDYEPENDEENDKNYPVIGDDDDDDFEIPPLRPRKTKKELTQTKKQTTTQRRVEKSRKNRDDGINNETLSLFQGIVGDNFEVRASEEYEDKSMEKRDRCLNPKEAAGFRATMKTLALEVKKAVRKGKNIKETYTDMIQSTIRIAKAMKYPGVASVQTEDILPSIKDIECHAWRKHLQGKDNNGTGGHGYG